MPFTQHSSDLLARIAAALAPNYVVDRTLGAGGAAIVYSATDAKHGRQVAIKVLRPAVAGTMASERFLREIRLAARLTHPHILPLLDSGAIDDLPYYVMPLVSGESLRDRIAKEKRLSVEASLQLAREMADALDYAHAVGIVHRDIKPENVLMMGEHCVVADFGVARAMDSATENTSALTSAGIAIGTPTYMSPEQATGDPTIDGRSDIYSLAIVVYEMLVGEPPFVGLTPRAVIAQRFSHAPRRLRESRDDVPAHVEQAVATALAIEPGDRYATVSEFARALTEARPAQTTAAIPVQTAASVAVLPFENMSTDPSNEYLCDGLAEEIIGSLSRLRGLRVAARTSAFAFKGQRRDAQSYGKELHVGHILEGSVQRSGNRVRISVRLIDTKTGFQLWADRFDRSTDDVFAIQDEIAGAVSRTLKVMLLGEAEHASLVATTRSAKAHDAYLRGRFLWNKRTEESLNDAVERFREAIAEDAEFASAYSGLAETLFTLGIYGAVAPDDVMPLAKEAAEKALAIDPSDAAPHACLASIRAVYDWDSKAAHEAFRRALSIGPRNPTAHHRYAIDYLVPQRRFDDALGHLATARETDPLSSSMVATIGVVKYFARDYPGAIAAQRDLIAHDENFAMAHYFLGAALRDAGQPGAVASFGRAIALTGGSPEMVAGLAQAHARQGNRDEARRELDRLAKLETGRYVAPSLFAQVHAALGETDEALTRLKEAVDRRDADLIFASLRPCYDNLTDDSRFTAVLARVSG